ncbi:MAG: ATP-binding protein [Bacteroidales bacterium]|nr:ATP-binding protein [Bacteroidales bacterium]
MMNNTASGPQKEACANRLTLANDLGEMPRFYAFVETLCQRCHFPSSLCMEVQLALEEVIVNVMNYAYPNEQGQHSIEVRYERNDNMLEFEVSDDGIAFDPTAYTAVDIDAPLEDRQVGGLGIHIARNMMDSMAYRREQNRNILTLRKSVAPYLTNQQ